MQQARGMLGFPLCFSRTGLFFHPKPSWSPRELKADLLKSAGRAGGVGGRERATFGKEGGRFSHNICAASGTPPLEGEMVSPKCWASC